MTMKARRETRRNTPGAPTPPRHPSSIPHRARPHAAPPHRSLLPTSLGFSSTWYALASVVNSTSSVRVGSSIFQGLHSTFSWVGVARGAAGAWVRPQSLQARQREQRAWHGLSGLTFSTPGPYTSRRSARMRVFLPAPGGP